MQAVTENWRSPNTCVDQSFKVSEVKSGIDHMCCRKEKNDNTHTHTKTRELKKRSKRHIETNTLCSLHQPWYISCIFQKEQMHRERFSRPAHVQLGCDDAERIAVRKDVEREPLHGEPFARSECLDRHAQLTGHVPRKVRQSMIIQYTLITSLRQYLEKYHNK